jgi:hypothetical protein
MRLKKSKNTAQEKLTALVNEGYRILHSIHTDFRQKRAAGTFESDKDHERYSRLVNEWVDDVVAALNSIFPTELEANSFLHPRTTFGAIAAEDADAYKAGGLRARLQDVLHGLERIIEVNLTRYTDLPIGTRLYVEDIDSFVKVRDVNPASVARFLHNGYLDLPEDVVQVALEQILDVPFHKKDWGGELSDLYTANVTINGARTATAFLLKGNGLKKRVMEIADCGKNGDQLVRLFDSPARLFIVQFVGEVSESVIKDVEGKVNDLRARGTPACYCIMSGQDTARVFCAYGKVLLPNT